LAAKNNNNNNKNNNTRTKQLLRNALDYGLYLREAKYRALLGASFVSSRNEVPRQ